MPLDSGKTDIYVYDKDDLKLKINCRNKIKQPFVVYNHGLYPNVDNNLISAFYNSTHQHFYRYKFDDKKEYFRKLLMYLWLGKQIHY